MASQFLLFLLSHIDISIVTLHLAIFLLSDLDISVMKPHLVVLLTFTLRHIFCDTSVNHYTVIFRHILGDSAANHCAFFQIEAYPLCHHSKSLYHAPSDWRPGGRRFNPHRGRQHSFVEIDHEIFSTVILSLPLIQEGQLSVSGERMCTILVNC